MYNFHLTELLLFLMTLFPFSCFLVALILHRVHVPGMWAELQTLMNSVKEMHPSPLVSASWMVLSAMLPSCSSEMFTPTIIRSTWRQQTAEDDREDTAAVIQTSADDVFCRNTHLQLFCWNDSK